MRAEAYGSIKDREKSRAVGGNLERLRSAGRGFKDNLEGFGLLQRIRGKNPGITFLDDGGVGIPTVDDSGSVAWKVCGGGPKGGLEEMLGEHITADIAIDAITGVIRVKAYQAIEMKALEVAFQNAHFRFRGVFPKLAIHVGTSAEPPGAIHIAGGIANRVKMNFEATGKLRIFMQFINQSNQRMNAGGFVAMNP